MTYFIDRDHMSADIVAGRVTPTLEDIATAFEQRGGYGPYEAACNAERFLADLNRGLERRAARPV